MSHNHTILGQMMQMFSRYDFQKAVNETKTEYHARGFKSWNHFIAMLFGQLSYTYSNEILYYRNEKGEKIKGYSEVYRCLNRECSTKYFTRPPEGVELYTRVHREVKKMTL